MKFLGHNNWRIWALEATHHLSQVGHFQQTYSKEFKLHAENSVFWRKFELKIELLPVIWPTFPTAEASEGFECNINGRALHKQRRQWIHFGSWLNMSTSAYWSCLVRRDNSGCVGLMFDHLQPIPNTEYLPFTDGNKACVWKLPLLLHWLSSRVKKSKCL